MHVIIFMIWLMVQILILAIFYFVWQNIIWKYCNLWHFAQNLNGPKPLRIRFDKIDRFIIIHDGKIKHLKLFDYGLLNQICDKIK